LTHITQTLIKLLQVGGNGDFTVIWKLGIQAGNGCVSGVELVARVNLVCFAQGFLFTRQSGSSGVAPREFTTSRPQRILL